VLSKKISSIYHEDIVRGDGLEALEFSGGGKEVNVKLSSGSTFTADTLISALPAYEIARLLKLHDTELAQMLESIEFASVAVITMTFDNHGDESNVIPKELHGFGYLVPPKYQEPVLGVVFDSLTFPQQQSSELTRVTVMIGGDLSNHAKVPDVTSMTDEQLTTVSREALQRHLGINQAPMATHVKVCKNGIAQYTVGHEKKIEKISQLIADKFPALKVAGSSYYGVGVNDCVRSTRTIVDSIKF
jgi:oxygen-dependent protoporphyrinogen oxidase